MSEELVYTSAQEGLKRGSHGFCTVISTPGVSKSLADRLESLSGYRHHFPPHDAQSNLNPVNFFHYVFSVGGDRFNVLSRVCNAGLDYTQRSNKLAHHVALRRDELVACGPAAVQSTPGFHDESFDGNPRHLGSGRTPSDVPSTLTVCDAWKRAAGDAGWAGYLAEAFLESRGQYTSVIYPVGADVLPLISEALSLVPRERRWEVTYSTYVTRLPAGVDCHWRFYLDGSKEANSLNRNPHATVIDLTATPGQASGGALVEAARAGRLSEPARKPEPKLERSVADEKTKPQAVVVPADAEESDRDALAVRVPPVTDDALVRSGDIPLVPDDASDRSGDIPPVLPGVKTTDATPPSLPRGSGEGDGKPPLDFSSKSASPYKIYSAVVTAVLLLVIVAVVINAIQPKVVDHAPSVADRDPDQPVVAAKSQEVDESERLRRKTEQQKQEQDRKRKEMEDGMQQMPAAKNGEEGQKPPQERNVSKKTASPPVDKRDPLKDIKARGKILVLPENNQTDIISPKASQRQLATLYTKQLRECNLKLVAALIAKPGVVYRLVEGRPKDQKRRTWSVTRAARENNGVGDEEPKVTRIGTFELKSAGSGTEQSLYFSWDKEVPSTAPSVLRLMDLEVIVGQQSAVCGLDKPKVLKAITVEFGNRRELGVNLTGEVGRHIRQHAAHVFLDVQLIGFEPKTMVRWLGYGADARGWPPKPIVEIEAKVEGIPMNKALIEVTIFREQLEAVKVMITFSGREKVPSASVAATWDCLVPTNVGDNIFTNRKTGFSLADARQGPGKTRALIKQRRSHIDKLKKEQPALKKRVSQLQATLIKTGNSIQKAMLTAQRDLAQNRVNAIPGSIKNQERVIKNLENSGPYQRALIAALEKYNKTCGFEWRIYLRKGGREKTLAISDRWLPEKRPAR